jgi:hypothetical protein
MLRFRNIHYYELLISPDVRRAGALKEGKHRVFNQAVAKLGLDGKCIGHMNIYMKIVDCDMEALIKELNAYDQAVTDRVRGKFTAPSVEERFNMRIYRSACNDFEMLKKYPNFIELTETLSRDIG